MNEIHSEVIRNMTMSADAMPDINTSCVIYLVVGALLTDDEWLGIGDDKETIFRRTREVTHIVIKSLLDVRAALKLEEVSQMVALEYPSIFLDGEYES